MSKNRQKEEDACTPLCSDDDNDEFWEQAFHQLWLRMGIKTERATSLAVAKSVANQLKAKLNQKHSVQINRCT